MAQIRTRETAAQVGDAGTITNNNAPLSNSQIDQNFINLNNDIAGRLPLTGGTLTGTLSVPSSLTVRAQGAEGGEIVFQKGTAQTSLAGDVILDTLGDTFRIFDNGGTYRQIFFNLTNGNITGAGGISISIDGNAATVTNGVYTSGNQTISGNKTFTGTTILGGGSSFIDTPSNLNSWFSTAPYGVSQGDNRTHFGYNAAGVYHNYIRGAKTFVAADLEVGGVLTNAGNQVLHAGNYSNYTINNAGRIKTYYIDNLIAVAAQAKRYEVARIGIDFNDWNASGSFEVELLENYFVSGLKKRYSVNYGYNSINSLTLVEMSGEGSNRFRVAIGSPVLVSGDHYYLPVYVDVRDYSGCSVIIRTNRLITTATNTAVGYTYINTNPTGSDISDFTADSTVNLSNAATGWQVGSNTVLHSTNYNTYAVANNGSTWTPHPNTFRTADWNYFYTDYGYIGLGPANPMWAHIYSDKNFYFNQGIWINGNRVLDAANYNTYALPLSGGTLTGTVNFSAGTWGQVMAPGSGTYNRHAFFSNNSLFSIEAALATDSVAGTKLPLILTWRGGYDVQGGFKVTGPSAAELGGHTVLHANNYNSYSPTLTGTGASGSWGISITGNAATVASLTPAQFFNNMGNNHGTYQDFNTVPGFGTYYLQGSTNSPTGAGGQQWYGFTLGLGNEYTYAQYATQIYWPRRAQNSDTYVYVRDKEGGVWTSWSKIKAGYADSSGAAGTAGYLAAYTSDSGYIARSYNTTAVGSPSQFFIKHSLADVTIGNDRGNITSTNRFVLTGDAVGDSYAGIIRIAASSGQQWSGISFPDTAAGSSNSNNYWFYGRGTSIADRTLTAHIPSYADYSSTGIVPSWGVYTTGSTQLFRVYSTGNVDISNNLTVGGNLIINGTTTTVNSTVTTIDDPIITLGGDTAPVSDDSKDRGVEFRWHNGSSAKVGFFGFDDSTGKFTFIPDATNNSEVFSGTKGTLDAYLDWSNITNNGETLATVTGRGATTSTNITLSGGGNHFNGHLYYDAYAADGSHYPHFLDGANGTGSVINWRLFTGGTNTVTHVWAPTYTQFNNRFVAPQAVISGGGTNSDSDATLLVTATNNNDWGIIVDKFNASATEYGVDIRVGSAANYAFRVVGNNVEGVRINGTGTVFAKSFVDIENNNYYLDPDGDLSLKVYGEISNSNAYAGNLQPGALNIGRTDTDYSYTGTNWAGDIRAGILANCSETWEFVVHDSGDSVNSALYFDGGARFMLGRDIGWGASYIEAPGSFRSSYFYDSSNTNYYWKPNTSAAHRLNTPTGYLDLGPMNTSHCHFQTDRPSFYFNTDALVNGSYRIYGDQNNRFSQGALVLRGASPTVYLRDTDHMSAQLHVSDNYFYILRGGVDQEGWTQVNSVWPLVIDLSNNNADFGGVLQAVTDVRAPIFYDRNDTAYYVNPNGSSQLNILYSNIYYQNPNISIGYLHAEASASIAAGGSNVLGDGVQQDLLAFNPPTTAETWNGSTWSSTTIPNSIFAGRIAQAFGGFDLTPTVTKARFTWNNFGYRFWHALNAAHTTQGNNIRFTLETSADGTAWVSHGTSSWFNSWPGYSTWTTKSNNSTSAPWMRITVERDVVNQNNINIGCINLMGSYGGFSRLFDWDYQRNVFFNNTVQAVDFNSTSDITKKKDVETIRDALQLVTQLRGVNFKWVSTDKPSMGLIAQEVEKVLPQVVHTLEDGTKTISYGNLVGLLVECVKAQEDRLTRLENLMLHNA